MNINEIIEMYNEQNLTLKEIGEKLNISKSTVQRKIAKSDFKLNKKTGKYETNVSDETNVSRETIKSIKSDETNVSRETIKSIKSDETNVSRETIKSIKFVNRTYAIDEKIDRALKIKSAVENKKVIDIVREALKSYIDDKYLNM